MEDKFILTKYYVPANLPKDITLALVTDLHEREPGNVLDLLKQSKPDMIMVVGDTFERHDEGKDSQESKEQGMTLKFIQKMLLKLDDLFNPIAAECNRKTEYMYEFFKEAAKLAPVFISLGNHEWYLLPEDKKAIEETCAVLLDNADCMITVKGVQLRIGGLSSTADFDWLNKYSKKTGYKILLCHHPEFYERYLKNKEIDLILSGHAHGGQIRVFGHGLFAPGQGVFPKYTKGLYDGKMVVSAGCSNTASVPRFGNPCEVVLIQLNASKESKCFKER